VFIRCSRPRALLACVLLATPMLTGCDTAKATWINPCANGYVALTFDDGPDPRVTLALLGRLRHYRVRATFFVIGANAQRYPDIIRREAAEGHSVQDHTWSHPDLTTLSVDQAMSQINQGADAVAAAGLPRPTFYRPPYNRTAKEIRETAARAGLTEVGYTTNPADTTDPGVERIVSRSLTARSGGIVNLHDHLHLQTIQAIDGIITGMREARRCPGRLTKTASRNTAAPTDLEFYAKAIAW
jgi:peptidoglycan-N-acetylglucosamine deacetylase